MPGIFFHATTRNTHPMHGVVRIVQVAEARPYVWRPLAIGRFLYVRRSFRFLWRCSRVIAWRAAFVGCRALRLCRAVALGGSQRFDGGNNVSNRLRPEPGPDRFPESSFRRLRFAMKLAAAHQPTGYIRRL